MWASRLAVRQDPGSALSTPPLHNDCPSPPNQARCLRLSANRRGLLWMSGVCHRPLPHRRLLEFGQGGRMRGLSGLVRVGGHFPPLPSVPSPVSSPASSMFHDPTLAPPAPQISLPPMDQRPHLHFGIARCPSETREMAKQTTNPRTRALCRKLTFRAAR